MLKSKETKANGYFGILVYFAQIVALVQIHDRHEHKIKDKINYVAFYINIFINSDPAQFSTSACPFKELTFGKKMLLKLCFFAGLYLSWIVIFFLIRQGGKRSWKKVKPILSSIQLKLVTGLIEIIAYTYEGIASVTFMSLLCVKIAGDNVWKYDAETKCLSSLQSFFAAFSIFYVFPFVISFGLAAKYLKAGRISSITFIFSCVLPFPFLFIYLWTVMQDCRYFKKGKILEMSSDFPSTSQSGLVKICFFMKPRYQRTRMTDVILESVEGPYNTIGQAVYWQSILGVRRLLMALTVFINTFILKFMLIHILSTLFLIHHITVKPFKAKNSNILETISLMLIVFIANFNAIKVYFLSSSISLEGTAAHVYDILAFLENTSLFLLLLVIIFAEICQRKFRRGKPQFHKHFTRKSIDCPSGNDIFT